MDGLGMQRTKLKSILHRVIYILGTSAEPLQGWLCVLSRWSDHCCCDV